MSMWHLFIQNIYIYVVIGITYTANLSFFFCITNNVETSITPTWFFKFKEDTISSLRCSRKVSSYHEELWFYGKKHTKIGKSQKRINSLIIVIMQLIGYYPTNWLLYNKNIDSSWKVPWHTFNMYWAVSGKVGKHC